MSHTTPATAAASPFSSRRRKQRAKLAGVLLTTALVAVVVIASLIEINPDWLSYQLIYETEGAWLSEQGRDPAFLLLIDFARSLFGIDGYDQFRNALAIYFVAFTALLAVGRILPIAQETKLPTSILVITILNFALARFTVQIREGVAATLLVFALSILLRPNAKTTSAFKSLVIFLLAALVHAGTSIYLLIALLAIWLTRDVSQSNRWRLVTIAAALIGVTVPLIVWATGDSGLLAQSIGERTDNGSELSLAKLALNLSYAAVSWCAHIELRRSPWIQGERTVGNYIIHLLSGPVLLCLNLWILTALLLSESNAVISSYSRFLYLCLGLCFLLAGLSGRARWITPTACLLLIFDQVRVISDSIAIYFGVSLF